MSDQEKKPEFSITVKSGEKVQVDVNWNEDNIEMVAEILSALVTGSLLEPAISSAEKFATGTDDLDGLNTIKEIMTERVMEQRELLVEEGPVVCPSEAINHLMLMYRHQG